MFNSGSLVVLEGASTMFNRSTMFNKSPSTGGQRNTKEPSFGGSWGTFSQVLGPYAHVVRAGFGGG